MSEIINIWMDWVNESLNIKGSSTLNKAKLLCFGSYKLGVSSP